MRISSVPRSHPRTIHFKLSDYEKTDTDEFYVLDAQPRSKNKFLFRGQHLGECKRLRDNSSRGRAGCQPFLVDCQN